MAKLINIKEAKKVLDESTILNTIDDRVEAERKINQLDTEKLRAQLLLEEQNDIIRMRRRWSNWLLGLIIAIVIFDFLIISGVGFGIVKFQNNYVIPLFIGESLVKTLGLAIIVVNFLFNKDKYKK